MPLLKQNIKQKSDSFKRGALFLCLGFFVLGCSDWSLNGSRERTPIETPLLEEQDRLAEEIELTSFDELTFANDPAEAESEGMAEQGESTPGQEEVDQTEPDCACNVKKETESDTDTDNNADSIPSSNDSKTDLSSLDQTATESESTTDADTAKPSASLTGFVECSSVKTGDCANVKNGAKVCALARETKNQKTSEAWLEFENSCSACSTGLTKIGSTTLEVVGFKIGTCSKEESEAE